ncbi:hypothetical protein TNCV_323611 [Trichonephila clavipes]|nr:hypothetical protein TNCV_323611 [Trichonephila clavipes]
MRVTILTRHDPIRECVHSALTQISQTNMNLEFFRTIGSTNPQPATHQHDNITVAPHLLTGYGMKARFASHMPSYCTVGKTCSICCLPWSATI